MWEKSRFWFIIYYSPSHITITDSKRNKARAGLCPVKSCPALSNNLLYLSNDSTVTVSGVSLSSLDRFADSELLSWLWTCKCGKIRGGSCTVNTVADQDSDSILMLLSFELLVLDWSCFIDDPVIYSPFHILIPNPEIMIHFHINSLLGSIKHCSTLLNPQERDEEVSPRGRS